MPLTEDKADRNRYRRQWALLPAGGVLLAREDGFAGWSRTAVGQRVLCAHPDTHIAIKVVEGRTVIVLGIAFDTARRAIASDPSSAPGSSSSDAITSWVVGLTGVFAVIADTTDRGVVVLADPGGIMGVYTDGQIVASTPVLWSVLEERYWPTAEPPRIESRDAIECVAKEFREAVQAVMTAHPSLLSITGGRDSRVYAAACEGGEGRAFTIVRGSAGARDAEIAREICGAVGLEHELLTAGPVPEWLDRLYDGMTRGMVPPHRRRILEACARLATPDAVHINGNLGGLSKAFYWAGGTPASVSAGDLVRDFLGVRAEAERGVRRWLDTTAALPPRTVCILMYLEQRGSRWMGPGETASALFYQAFTSFSSRTFFDCYDGCPEPYQLSGRFLIDLVGELNPALARIPYASGTSRLLRMIPKPVKVAVKKWIKK